MSSEVWSVNSVILLHIRLQCRVKMSCSVAHRNLTLFSVCDWIMQERVGSHLTNLCTLSLSVCVFRCSSRRYTDSPTQQHSTFSRCTPLSSSISCCKPLLSSSSTASAPLNSRAWPLYSRSANGHHKKFSHCKDKYVVTGFLQDVIHEMVNLSVSRFVSPSFALR